MNRIARFIRGTSRVLTRPGRRVGRRGALVVEAYRGFGSRERIFVMGRVYRQPPSARQRGDTLQDLADLGRRLMRFGVDGAIVKARFGAIEGSSACDKDGYFRFQLRLVDPPPGGRLWHRVDIQLLEPEAIEVQTQVYIPPRTSRYLVISDIDDTVMTTGVANKAKMLWRLFVEDAESRVAFPGVAAFLQALHAGRSGTEMNPMLYVSRAPWTIYEMLSQFFRLHEIPVGPLLFLREWGATLQSPMPRRAKHHKRDLIELMMEIYPGLPVVLIGDSGQRDPEIYAGIVSKHGARVAAVYIRDVSDRDKRSRTIDALALNIADAGSRMLLAADTETMATDARARGLIAADASAAVRRERERSACPGLSAD